MQKVTLITASPRKKGNSNKMAAWFKEEAEKHGATVTTFDAVALKLDGCHACNACYKNGHACAFEHGFDPIAESILESDTIVFTIPVYWFSMPGQVKNIIDHLYALFVGGKDFGKKHMVVLGTMGQPVATNVFEGVTVAMKKSAEFVGWTYEELCYGEMNAPDAILNTDAKEQIAKIVERLA